MNDALAKILSTSNLLGHGGLVGDIDRLQRTTPELVNGKPTVLPPSLDSLSGVQLAGLSSQISALFQLHAARGAIDDLINQTKGIEEQANGLEFPLTRIVQRMMKIDRIEHFSLLSVRLSQHSVQRCYKWHLQVADERQEIAPGLSAEDSVLVLQTNQIIPVEVEKLRRTLIGRAIFLVNLQPDPLETLSKDQNAEGKFKQ